MLIIDKVSYEFDIKKWCEKINYIEKITLEHFEINLNGWNNIIYFDLMSKKYWIDNNETILLNKEFKFYLDSIIEFGDLHKFVNNLYNYKNNEEIIY